MGNKENGSDLQDILESEEFVKAHPLQYDEKDLKFQFPVLPIEIWDLILFYLPIPTLQRIKRVCRYYYTIISKKRTNERFWGRKVEEHLPERFSKDCELSNFEKFIFLWIYGTYGGKDENPSLPLTFKIQVFNKSHFDKYDFLLYFHFDKEDHPSFTAKKEVEIVSSMILWSDLDVLDETVETLSKGRVKMIVPPFVVLEIIKEEEKKGGGSSSSSSGCVLAKMNKRKNGLFMTFPFGKRRIEVGPKRGELKIKKDHHYRGDIV